jgi:hypothetical protein
MLKLCFILTAELNNSHFGFSLFRKTMSYFNSVSTCNLFLNIACIMNSVTKKTKTHKAKSTESILLQQNHRSKNIIICKKITKQSKQNSYASLEMIFLKYIIFQKGR